MPAKVTKLGPGKLTVGATGVQDFTCQVTAARVEWSVDSEDAVLTLCGDSVPGARTYSASLTATIYNDLGSTPGIVEYSWTNKGSQQPFVFQPSTVTGVKQVVGNLIIDPISVGGDEVGQNMESDIEWEIVGAPTLTTPTVEDAAALEASIEEETSGRARRELVGTGDEPAAKRRAA
jgi:hypothetical protein